MKIYQGRRGQLLLLDIRRCGNSPRERVAGAGYPAISVANVSGCSALRGLSS